MTGLQETWSVSQLRPLIPSTHNYALYYSIYYSLITSPIIHLWLRSLNLFSETRNVQPQSHHTLASQDVMRLLDTHVS